MKVHVLDEPWQLRLATATRNEAENEAEDLGQKAERMLRSSSAMRFPTLDISLPTGWRLCWMLQHMSLGQTFKLQMTRRWESMRAVSAHPSQIAARRPYSQVMIRNVACISGNIEHPREPGLRDPTSVDRHEKAHTAILVVVAASVETLFHPLVAFAG